VSYGAANQRYTPAALIRIRTCDDRREADDGTRTRYLELGKLALYQVSYVRWEARFYGRGGGFRCLPFLA
jgi:hypothetical protein